MMENEEMVEKTPKRTMPKKRRAAKTTNTPTATKRQKRNPKSEISDDDGGDISDAITPRVHRAIESESRSPSVLASPAGDVSAADDDEDFEEEEEDFEDDDDLDEDYGDGTKRKSATPGRKKKVAKRKFKDEWTVVKEFEDDVSLQDYLENTAWFRDKDTKSEEGQKTLYFCGEASGKTCPAKAYSLFPFAKEEKIVLYANGKEHKHQSGRRGIPEVVKREIRRILDQSQVSEISEILAKLAERKMQLPTKPQIKNFVTVVKKPKIRLPKSLKTRKDRADSSDADTVAKKGKTRLRSVHRNSSSGEEE